MGSTAHAQRIGMRDYHQGVLYGQPCVIALTRVGKVAAAATTATLLHEFDVERVVFAHNVILERNAYDALERALEDVL